jgi:hypothetical protein
MQHYQWIIIVLFALVNFLFFIKGYIETRKKNAFRIVPYPLMIFGIFVWGDAVVISLFLALASMASLLLWNWILFLLILTSFWLMRSIGETIYWFNHQFCVKPRYPAKYLPGFGLYQNDSIYFAIQIFVQCISVVSLILTIYLVHLWLA